MKVKSLLFFLAGIFFVSCVSMQDDLIVNSAYEGNALYDKYISRMVSFDGAQFRGELDKVAVESFITEVEGVLDSNSLSRKERAFFTGIAGRCNLLLGRNSVAEDLSKTAISLQKGEPQALILSLRLLSPSQRLSVLPDLSMQSDSAYPLQIEKALALFSVSDFSSALAAFDSAFINLPDYYRESYSYVRNLCWSLKDGVKTDDTGINKALNSSGITIEDLILITSSQSDLLEPVTGGKALSTQELIRMADAAGFFDNQETMGKGKSEYTGKISRKLCARFLWNLYVRNMGDSTLFTRYYNRYEKYGKSPLEDVDLENPDFNGIIGCVEKEIMTVPEGTRFYPDAVVPGGDFLGWIKNLEKGL